MNQKHLLIILIVIMLVNNGCKKTSSKHDLDKNSKLTIVNDSDIETDYVNNRDNDISKILLSLSESDKSKLMTAFRTNNIEEIIADIFSYGSDFVNISNVKLSKNCTTNLLHAFAKDKLILIALKNNTEKYNIQSILIIPESNMPKTYIEKWISFEQLIENDLYSIVILHSSQYSDKDNFIEQMTIFNLKEGRFTPLFDEIVEGIIEEHNSHTTFHNSINFQDDSDTDFPKIIRKTTKYETFTNKTLTEKVFEEEYFYWNGINFTYYDMEKEINKSINSRHVWIKEAAKDRIALIRWQSSSN